MSQSMLEKAAEALWASPVNKRAVKWSDITSEIRKLWIEDVKRVLKVLSNPTPDLIEGVMQASLDCTPINRCEQQALQVWQNTLNAILEQQ